MVNKVEYKMTYRTRLCWLARHHN